MKKTFAVIILCLLVATGLFAQNIPPVPNPPRLVNDFTKHFLTPDQIQLLESKLVAYNDSTSNQVTVVIMETIGNADPGDFANELGEKWGVGGKEFNNGVVILITVGGGEGRRHVFIATGFGLESAIPDYTAKEIVNNEMIPQLRAGNPYRAINDAIDAIMRAAAGEYKATAKPRSRQGGRPIFFILIVMFIIIMAIARRGGGGGGGMMSRRGYRRSIPPIIWFPTGGGGFGGGGGGWSGGGGGGFGGFGGGGFGGGGAGGNW